MKKPKRHSNYRTILALRKEGWLVESVEQYIAEIRKYRDYLHMVDAIALKPGAGVVFIQSTTKAHLARHRDALLKNPDLLVCLQSGARFQIWSWRRVKGLPCGQEWAARVEEAKILPSGLGVRFDLIVPGVNGEMKEAA